MREEKKQIRAEMRTILTNLSPHTHKHLSMKIATRLFQLEEWKAAHTIGITVAVHPEVETAIIIEQAWKEGKKVAVPKCVPSIKLLNFRGITGFHELETVFFGLREPNSETIPVELKQIDLLIVPGLAFTTSGQRLGFGGGYYDRLLPNFQGNLLALAFEQQLRERLPVEGHDFNVPKIVTPERIYRKTGISNE